MNKYLYVFIIAFLAPNIFGQEYLNLREKIHPLQSSREEIERSFKTIRASEEDTRYETELGTLIVYYSKKPCVGHGWNIPPSRVLEFRVLFDSPVPSKNIIAEPKGFISTMIDDGTMVLTDRHKGLIVAIRSGTEVVDEVKFVPTEKQATLRCIGFPAFDPVGEWYAPYRAGSIKTVATWDVGGSVGSTMEMVMREPQRQGFIFIYCKKGLLNQCRNTKSKVERVASEFLGAEKKRLTIKIGGYRDNLEFETYLVPLDLPPATPRPLYPGKF